MIDKPENREAMSRVYAHRASRQASIVLKGA